MSDTELKLINPDDGFLATNTLTEAMNVAEIISKSSFCPKQFANKTGDILVCMQMGKELGLKPMQALQNIAVINGRPSLWGDAMVAICRASKGFEYINETFDDTSMMATCAAKRKGEPEVVRTFAQEDAKNASLWGKQGPWTQYPKRMLAMRARGFCLRDAFADSLRGMISAEEAKDYPTEEKVVQSVLPMTELTKVRVHPIELQKLRLKMAQAGSTEENVCKAMKADKLEDMYPEDVAYIHGVLNKKIEQAEKIDKETGEVIQG